MSSSMLQAHLDLAGKVLDDPPAFLLWDRSYCCCDCCLQVRDSLGVVAIHHVLKVSPQIKIWGFKFGECGNHCRSQPVADQSVSQKNVAVAISVTESEVFGRSRSRNILSDSDSSCPLSLRICDVSRATYAAARTSGVQYSNLFKRTLPHITRHSVRLIKSLHFNL